jgi:hypothetical protein
VERQPKEAVGSTPPSRSKTTFPEFFVACSPHPTGGWGRQVSFFAFSFICYFAAWLLGSLGIWCYGSCLSSLFLVERIILFLGLLTQDMLSDHPGLLLIVYEHGI